MSSDINHPPLPPFIYSATLLPDSRLKKKWVRHGTSDMEESRYLSDRISMVSRKSCVRNDTSKDSKDGETATARIHEWFLFIIISPRARNHARSSNREKLRGMRNQAVPLFHGNVSRKNSFEEGRFPRPLYSVPWTRKISLLPLTLNTNRQRKYHSIILMHPTNRFERGKTFSYAIRESRPLSLSTRRAKESSLVLQRFTNWNRSYTNRDLSSWPNGRAVYYCSHRTRPLTTTTTINQEFRNAIDSSRRRKNTRNRPSGTIPRRGEGTAVENTWPGIERDTPVAIT